MIKKLTRVFNINYAKILFFVAPSSPSIHMCSFSAIVDACVILFSLLLTFLRCLVLYNTHQPKGKSFSLVIIFAH